MVLETLLNSSNCSLQHLNLSNNEMWFKDDRGLDMLTEVIRKYKSCLEILKLASNKFKTKKAEKLMTTIADCGVCNTLKELYFRESLYCKHRALFSRFQRSWPGKLAKILSNAPLLKKIDISMLMLKPHNPDESRE